MRVIITATTMLAALLWATNPATVEAHGGGHGGGGHGGGGHGGGGHGGGHGGGGHHGGSQHRRNFFGGFYGYGYGYYGGYGYGGYGGWGYGRYGYPDYNEDGYYEESTAAEQPAHLLVRVAPDATVYFDGFQTKQTGPIRHFVTPPLEQGDYQYEVRATWTDNGRRMDQTRKVTIHPGDAIRINFLPAKSAPADQP